jgi:hypothetical protein
VERQFPLQMGSFARWRGASRGREALLGGRLALDDTSRQPAHGDPSLRRTRHTEVLLGSVTRVRFRNVAQVFVPHPSIISYLL